MAATNPTSRTAESTAGSDDSGAGMAHLTIVPENFDPEENGWADRRED